MQQQFPNQNFNQNNFNPNFNQNNFNQNSFNQSNNFNPNFNQNGFNQQNNFNQNGFNQNGFNQQNNQFYTEPDIPTQFDEIRPKPLDSSAKRLENHQNPFKLRLKPHQEALLYRALELDEQNVTQAKPFGVLSDKPGSGKTFVVLAMIYYAKKLFGAQGCNVIVVPHNIYSQWVDAIEMFLGKLLSYKCLLEYNEITALYTNTQLLYRYDIIITTPLNYGVFASTINSIGFHVRRVFFDEADTMKNLLVDAIRAKFTWFISASIQRVFDPKTLKANIGIYELYLPELLKNECYCKNSFIDANIKLEKPNTEVFVCRDFYLDSILVNILQPEQLEAINAHDYTDIRSECDGFPVKTTRDIVRQMYIYSKQIVNEQEELLKDLEKKLKFPNRQEYNRIVETHNTAQIRRDRYLNIHMKIKMLTQTHNICIECWTPIPDIYTETADVYMSECGDTMCFGCWEKISEKYKCVGCKNPHPKTTYTPEEFEITKKMIKENLKNKLNKFMILDKIIDLTGDKVLMYTKYRGISNYLKNASLKLNFEYLELNGGNIKQIDTILKEFKTNPKIKILLIDDSYFGVGLNIEYATDFIFIHKTDKEIEKQLIGRAQRFGRTSKLNVWKLLYKNEKK